MHFYRFAVNKVAQ